MTDRKRNAPMGFRFFAGMDGVYESGVTPVQVDANGNLSRIDNLFGTEANLGVTGLLNRAQSSLALSYTGNYRKYTEKTYLDGSDNMLSLEGQYNFTRHLSITSRNSAGSASRAFGNYSSYVPTPEMALGLLGNEIYDNRIYFLQVTDEISYQASSRLSLLAGGDGFFVRRKSKALVGTDGYGAHGSLAYRLDRVQTLDVSYSYLHYDYPRAFGDADIHQVTAGYSRAFSRTLEMSLSAGAFRADTVGSQTVKLDPATAALFGQLTTIQAYQKTRYLPSGGANLKYRMHRASFTVGYDRTPNPGNGVFLVSSADRAYASVNYAGNKRYSIGLSANWQKMTSVGQPGLGNYVNTGGGADFSYDLGHAFHLSSSIDLRQFNIDLATGLSRLSTRAMFGIRYSPGERPIQFFR